jgi:hypothetical protein
MEWDTAAGDNAKEAAGIKGASKGEEGTKGGTREEDPLKEEGIPKDGDKPGEAQPSSKCQGKPRRV